MKIKKTLIRLNNKNSIENQKTTKIYAENKNGRKCHRIAWISPAERIKKVSRNRKLVIDVKILGPYNQRPKKLVTVLSISNNKKQLRPCIPLLSPRVWRAFRPINKHSSLFCFKRLWSSHDWFKKFWSINRGSLWQQFNWFSIRYKLTDSTGKRRHSLFFVRT